MRRKDYDLVKKASEAAAGERRRGGEKNKRGGGGLVSIRKGSHSFVDLIED